MNIGIFDSGLGGLLITKSLIKKIPQYNYIYLGDTKRVPYGNRSPDTIYEFLKEAVEYLFKNDCKLVIVACNTASAQALRRIQQEFLPYHYPDRRVLGVIIPTCEVAATGSKKIGVIATQATVESGAFVVELKKIDKNIRITQYATPLLVPIIENDAIKFATPILKEYLKPFKNKIDTLILGCTHYPILKKEIQKIVGNKVKVIAQNDLIGTKLKDYLARHPEIEKILSKKSKNKFFVTDTTSTMQKNVKKWFGKDAKLENVSL